MKPNQKLKYLNKGSCHTNSCFNTIPLGVFNCTYMLTSQSAKNMKTRLDVLYLLHMKALTIAKLATAPFPKMSEVVEKMELKAAEQKNLIRNKRLSQHCALPKSITPCRPEGIHMYVPTLPVNIFFTSLIKIYLECIFKFYYLDNAID